MTLMNFIRSEIIGPYPYFWIEKDLCSHESRPMAHYYLWVKTKRFGKTMLIELANSTEGFEELEKEWRKELSK